MKRLTVGVWLTMVAVLAAGVPAAQAKPYDEKALRAARERLPLSTVAPTRPGAFETTPDGTGAFVYEATSLRPLIGNAPVALSTNTPSGVVVANVRPIRTLEPYFYKDNEGAYWKLGALPEGDYWIGLLSSGGHPALYLNGRLVQLEQATVGAHVGSGLVLSELRTGRATRLRPGDELAVLSAYGWRAARLILRPPAPPPARHYLAPHYDSHRGGPETALAVNGQIIFHGANGAVLPTLQVRDGGRNQRVSGPEALEKASDGRPAVRGELFNPLPVPVEVDYSVALRSYFRLPVGGVSGRVRLEPHTRFRTLVPFDALPDERAFSAELKVRVVEPEDQAAWRKAMHWPELDWIEFFPGMRQGLAWPESFTDYELRRVEFGDPVRAVRRVVLLDGDEKVWQEAYSTNWQTRWPAPEPLRWAAGRVPSKGVKTAAGEPAPNALYLRRTFVLPADAAGGTCELRLEQAAHEAALYVNGIEVGRVRGGNSPLWADATAAIRPGTNELVIVSRDALAIMNPAYINPADPQPNLNYLDAPGHYEGGSLHVGSLELCLAPRVAARGLQVVPSTRRKTLQARCELVNNRDRRLKLKIRARVFEADKPVFDLGERECEVAPGASAPLEFSKPWPEARWWWPFDPHLYVMAVETGDATTGERLDLLRERFGFRESWIDGPRLMLNDLAIRPKGSALGYREAPNHFARGVDGSAGPDYGDERGMMGGTYITSLGNTSSRHNVERDPFWATAETNALAAVRQDFNHPSIARWDMSNEWLQYLDHPNPLVGTQRFKKLSDAVRALDPSRWTTFGAEGDVHGVMDHFDFHYMKPYFGSARMRGVYPYLPDGDYWRELHKEFPAGAAIPLNSHEPDVVLRPDEKMFFERESLWKVGDLMPPATTTFAGEQAVLWSAWDSSSGPTLWMWKQQIDGPRDFGVALINHFTHPGLRRRAMALQTFIVPEVQHHGFGGRTIERRYAVLQDLFRTCDMVFRWTLRGPDGRRLDGGQDRQRMTSGTTHRGVLRVRLPEVKARTACVLTLELESDGVTVMAEERDLAVWPEAPVPAGKLTRKVLLFEPEGSPTGNAQQPTSNVQRPTPNRQGPTAKALAAAGVPFETVSTLAALPASPLPSSVLLILAEDALDEGNRRAVGALTNFVERGGRVLLLRQTVTALGLPVETSLDVKHWASQCYLRAANHPVVAGWTDWDFHFWAEDRAVTRGGYVKPSRGPATVIVDSGEQTQSAGLEWAGLMELYRGSGLYLLCQLPVAAKYDEEPMARELLARMMAYLGAGTAFRSPTATLSVMTAPDSPMVERLKAVEAAFEVVSPDAVLNGKSRVLVDAAAVREAAPARVADWAAAIEAGAVMTVAEAGPADAGWLGELAGRPVSFSVPPYGTWDGRGMRTAWTPLTAGLSQMDQYWKRFDSAQNAGGQAEDTQYVIEPFQEYAVSVSGAGVIESVWPGALVELSRGAGRLALDQRNLYTSHPNLTLAPDRSVSALALGMGGRLAAAVEYPEMPATVAYRPIALDAWVNRALMDEIPEDGQGGWTDQGSGADLREFPTRNRRLAGVPFVFAPGTNKCIVLRNARRPFPERLPQGVTLPVGQAVAGLYFLHAAAYGGRPSAVYEIQYEDGTRNAIALMMGKNIADWVNAAAELPRERGTRSILAWTGRTPRFSRVGVYRMEWVNPHPEKTVAAVRFYKPEKTGGVPILMALTAAVPAGAGGVGPAAADRARAVALAVEAAAALKAGDLTRAAGLVAGALALDEGCEDAYAVRGDLADKSGREDERLAVYQDWIDTGATRPRPYNEVGAILEKRGNLRGALDAYRQSLKVEWNQPPTIEIRSRLEQQVK